MREELLRRLREITPEEQALLSGGGGIRQELYTSRREFVVDSRKLLERGRLVELRTHTRFAPFPRHRHNYVELVYMCTGSTTHIIDGTERVALEAGDLLFLNQNVFHEILPAGEEDVAVNFIILPEFFSRPISMIERENVLRDFLLSTLADGSSRSRYLHVRAGDILPVEALIESMIWILLDGRSGANTIVQTSMGLLFMNLSAFAGSIRPSGGEGEETDTVFRVLRYIEENYQRAALSQAARLAGLPDYALSRLLKNHTGANFKQLLQRRRLQQAAYLLDNTTLPVEAVLEHIGYDNSSYFYRLFRQRYGCSPGEYRESARRGGAPERPRHTAGGEADTTKEEGGYDLGGFDRR